jgi:hypothetical protein
MPEGDRQFFDATGPILKDAKIVLDRIPLASNSGLRRVGQSKLVSTPLPAAWWSASQLVLDTRSVDAPVW